MNPFRRERPADPEHRRRTPPGQALTDKWPVLHVGGIPQPDLDRWRFRVAGLVERELALTWAELAALPRAARTADFHCVTGWSRLDNRWEGVSTRAVLDLAVARPEARFVLVHGLNGYTTNLPLADFLSDDALFATHHDGEPLSPEHGGPLRLVVPHLYAWKSAKWCTGFELLADDRPGFWERGGYHMYGDPWREQRFNR